jgi:hypothetical protein
VEVERAEARGCGGVHAGGAGVGARQGRELEEELVHGEADEGAGVHFRCRALEVDQPTGATYWAGFMSLLSLRARVICSDVSACVVRWEGDRSVLGCSKGSANRQKGWSGRGFDLLDKVGR